MNNYPHYDGNGYSEDNYNAGRVEMKSHKVIGIHSKRVYFTGTLDQCENFIAYEIAGVFLIEGVL